MIAKPETNVVLAGPDQAAAAGPLLDVVQRCRVEKTRTTYRTPEHRNVTVW